MFFGSINFLTHNNFFYIFKLAIFITILKPTTYTALCNDNIKDDEVCLNQHCDGGSYFQAEKLNPQAIIYDGFFFLLRFLYYFVFLLLENCSKKLSYISKI